MTDTANVSVTAAPQAHQMQDEKIPAKLILSILATGIMAFIGIMTETLMNVLLPELSQTFHVGTSVIQWLTTGYLLVVSIVTPLSSYFNRKFKIKTTFIAGVVMCIAGAVIAVVSVNFPMLMVARVLQGAGTGIALPLMFNIILEQSPRSKIGMLMGLGNMVCAIAPALGPAIGGIVCTFISWRWIFGAVIIILAIALALGLYAIEQPRPTVDAHLNPLQVAALSIGFIAFVFALDRAGSAITALSTGQSGAAGELVFAIVLFVVAIVALVALALMCRRSFSPMLRLGVLRSVPFRWHLLAYVMLEGVTIGFGYLVPQLSQLGFLASAMVSGLLVLPGALLGAVAAPISGSLLDKFGPLKPIMTAMCGVLVGVGLFVFCMHSDTNVWWIGLFYGIYIISFSMSYANTMTAGMACIPAEYQADGNALFSTFQQLAGAVGTAVMSVCLGVAQGTAALGTDQYAANTRTGGHAAAIVLFVVVICAFLANLRAFVAEAKEAKSIKPLEEGIEVFEATELAAAEHEGI